MSGISLLAALLLSATTASAQAVGEPGYIYSGFVIAPHCGSVEEGAFSPQASEDMQKSSIFVSYGKCNGVETIWLSEHIRGDKLSGENIVLDRISVRPLAKDEYYLGYGSGYCYLKNDKKKTLLPFAGIFKSWDAGQIMTFENGFLKEGWLFNVQDKKIEKASPQSLKSIACEDEG